MMNPSPEPVFPPDLQGEGSARDSRLDALQRWGGGVLVAGLLAFVAWAALAPLDEGVPTQAVVSIDTKRRTIQHQQGGIIREVLVREGEEVKEGQILIRLQDSVVRANMEATRQRYLGLRAMESRLLAEQAGVSRITWHPDVAAEGCLWWRWLPRPPVRAPAARCGTDRFCRPCPTPCEPRGLHTEQCTNAVLIACH